MYIAMQHRELLKWHCTTTFKKAFVAKEDPWDLSSESAKLMNFEKQLVEQPLSAVLRLTNSAAMRWMTTNNKKWLRAMWWSWYWIHDVKRALNCYQNYVRSNYCNCIITRKKNWKTLENGRRIKNVSLCVNNIIVRTTPGRGAI